MIYKNFNIKLLVFILLVIIYKTSTTNTNTKTEHTIKLFNNKTEKFDYVLNKFKVYNKLIDTTTVEKFIEVVEYYKLDTTKELFDICISQICVESGAKQFYPNGKLVESSGNAVGMTQIVPSTAYHYLRNFVGDKHKEEFIKLGASNYDHLFKYDKYPNPKKNKKIYSKTRELGRLWTIDITNNIILWGFIMNKTLTANNNEIIKTLISYNIGDNGLSKYIKDKKDLYDHEYVVMIMRTNKKLTSSDV